MATYIRRREFVVTLGSAAAAWPVGARAQQAAKVWRVGMLETVSATLNAANFNAFTRVMRDLGYVERENLVIEYRSADGSTERFPDLANELVRLSVDLIVTRGTPAALAAKKSHDHHPDRHGCERGAAPLRPNREPGATGRKSDRAEFACIRYIIQTS
jgi:ABC-type uncharacterized transport system substrate-binding protein